MAMPPRSALAVLAASVLVGLAACDEAPVDDRGCARETDRIIPLFQLPPIDLLFVVDRSPSMADEGDRLAQQMQSFANTLFSLGAVPDLHVGVVTSDLGGDRVPGCGTGDLGRLQGGARCGLDASYVRVRERTDGTIEQNFSGDLGATLACLGTLPLSTCPVSQPLAAAVRAVGAAEPQNDGFRRAGAYLMIVIVTDGDDCSLVDPTALAGATGATPAEVEAAVDHACFALGTRCTPSDPAALGAHTACAPRADGGLLDVAAALGSIAVAEEGSLVAGVIDGSAHAEAEVVAGPRLAPVCAGTSSAGPAPRLAAVLGALPERASATSVCADDWSDALTRLAGLLRIPLGVPCFEAAIDLDPATAGVQPECVVQLARELPDGTVDVIASLPACADAVPGNPCLAPFRANQTCIDGVELDVDLGDWRVPDGTYADVRCRLACP